MRSPAGGEIGEAPPVADEASRFRGSAPIGGHDSARQSVGTTVGKRAPPQRTIKNPLHRADRVVRPYKEFCRGRCLHRPAPPHFLQKTVIAKPVRTLAVAIRSPRPLCRGITDSHDQSADWSRNDTQVLSASVIARAQGTRGNPSPSPRPPCLKGAGTEKP